ncbi:MAG: glutamine--fructose-6-phosphate transaminase (isomerizing) [Pyramidobacter sp.]|nr:glutamine--fructose-6-phosphate transaminase (isomerizing) [Pyramidobacter sp.]
MCGIVGYIGNKRACDVIVKGLERLEYRGYDSAGIAVHHDGKFKVVKTVGKVAQLKELIGPNGLDGCVGIGHTRWATHGGVTTANAHPHADEAQTLTLVHNGIIENYAEARRELEAEGVCFSSETDTEVAAQLLARLYSGDPVKAICELFKRFRGAFAFVIIFGDRPDELYCVRKGAPLVVALGDDEAYCASDVPAVVEHADRVIFLDEGEICRLTRGKASFWNLEGEPHERAAISVDVDCSMIDKGGYPHFMLKEINEQGAVLRRALFGRVCSDGIDMSGEWGMTSAKAQSFRRLTLIACGTSYYAAMVAQRVLEKYLSLDIVVDIASEYRYRPLRTGAETLALFVSQSGETLDTLEALRHMKAQGAYTVAVTNAPNSSIAREVDDVLRLNAGVEIGVAATKTFTAQMTVLILAGLHLARLRGELSDADEKRLAHGMTELPYKVEQVLLLRDQIKELARTFSAARDFLFLGRGVSFPAAMEGALKLKEISYVHAEAYAAGEMKHGPIALLDEKLPVVVIAPSDELFEKTISNVQETRARKAPVLFVTTEGVPVTAEVEGLLRVPATEPELSPFVTVVPLQLFAYESALLRGCSIDQPRNLAKSVTVE